MNEVQDWIKLMGDEMKEYTHIATNKKTGEVVKVIFNKKTGKYEENHMVQLIEKYWDIKKLTLPEPPKCQSSLILIKKQ